MLNIFSLLANAGTEPGSSPILTWGVIYVLLFGGMYFFMIRPQKKKQKAIQEMRNNIKVGDSVLTAGGLYGKIIDEVNNVFIVEFGTNKSVRIPVKKEAISSVEEPELRIKREEVAE